MNLFFRRIPTLLLLVMSTAATRAQDNTTAPFVFDKTSKVWHSERNDGQTIEVIVKIGDPSRQMKILRNGLEIWIDTKGKKNKKTGVLYPLASASMTGAPRQAAFTPTSERSAGQGDNRPNMHLAIAAMLQEKKEIELKGFKEELNGKHHISFSTGIELAISFGEKDTMEYRIRVPLSLLPNPVTPAKPIAIGIIMKGMQMPDMAQGGGFPGGEDGPGGNMPPPGGGGGGGMPPGGRGQNGPSSSDMQELFKEDIIWVKLKAL